MKQYFYFQIFRKTIIQFLDAFNDIKIARYNSTGTAVEKYITVPIKMATKEKFWYWYNQRKDHEILPMITAWISSIDWATERVANQAFEFCEVENDEVKRYLHPCPYNLGVQMQIWSLHMVDVDQIMEQILPFFCPHIFLRIDLDELGLAFDIKTIFRSATPEVSYEIDDDNYRVINYTLDFEIQTWFFKPTTKDGIIETIYANIANQNNVAISTTLLGASAFPSGGFSDTTTIMLSAASGGYDFSGSVDDRIITYKLYEPGLKETNPTTSTISASGG